MKIAHISDLHLRKHQPGSSRYEERLSRKVPGLLEEAMKQIGEESPALLVVSGDLIDYPSGGAQASNVYELAKADLILLLEILKKANCPLAVIHGNHDPHVSVKEVFGHLPEDQIISGHRVVCFSDHEWDAQGARRNGREKEKFIRVLNDDDATPQIHVQHYLIEPDIREDYPFSYQDAAFLKKSNEKSGRVRLCLSGHYHQGTDLFEQSGIHYSVVPAFCQVPHPIRFYEIDGETINSRQVSCRVP